MSLPLIALFIAAFAFGTTEFVIAGVLPNVAAGLDVSIPAAGYLVTGYAIGMAVGGPLMTIATGRVPRKTLITSLLIAFTAGQLACALAPDFTSMLLLRIAIAVTHGVYFGAAMVVAVRLVPESKRGMAVAFVLAGLTASGIFGVPAGAAVGNLFGWRATFWAMFALGIVSAIAVFLLLPRTPQSSQPPAGLVGEIRVLGRQQVWTSLILMILLMIAQFVPYTYIAPLLQEVTGLAPEMVPWVLLFCGIGATAGVFVGGRLASWALMPSVIILFALQAVVMTGMYFLSADPWPMVVIVTLWGGINFAIGTPIQTRILSWTADAPNLASSLIPSGFNVGIALAATIGAMLLSAGFGYANLPLLGIFAMVIGTGVATLSFMRERRSGATPPATAPA